MLFVSCSIPRTMSYRARPLQRSVKRTPSASSESPPSPSRTASFRSAMLAQVCLALSLLSSPPPYIPSPSRLTSLLYPNQNTRRRLLWHRPPLRLARHPPPQYSPLPNAVRRRRSSRVGWKTSSCRKAHEKEVGGRLGRVQETQGARGPFSSPSSSSPLISHQSLRAIPFHPCIIPLYDFFLLPDTKELYFVFESMEGNLYHLIKARKGRPLAGGLVASIFRQIVSGLHHIHASGYFHRDMKPENVLVTTTGLFEYRSLSPVAPPTALTEKDVVAIIKLADFGLARETASSPPYTEYVSTRWYRAPEVLLLSRDYSNPVDMWALGTIMAELVNLRPLFPGSDQIDQIHRICEVLGDPADYGSDARGRSLGGAKWSKGLKMAKQFNFAFPKVTRVFCFHSAHRALIVASSVSTERHLFLFRS